MENTTIRSAEQSGSRESPYSGRRLIFNVGPTNTRKRNPTRAVRIGTATIGAGNPIAVQSMCATRTQDVEATIEQVNALTEAGTDIIRIAVDSKRDAAALAEIRSRTAANLSVDLQENYRLVNLVAPHVDKVRYNPGHLYHHKPDQPWREKVRFILEQVEKHGCALRVGVNCGSVDPDMRAKFAQTDWLSPMLASATEHCELIEQLGFRGFCVSLKNSDPIKVIELNERFALDHPEVPLHLGVTEAGIPPDGIYKTRVAFEHLLSRGIGDTLRVSLTLPSARKCEETRAGREILADVAAGHSRIPAEYRTTGLNIISCPGCSRVENKAFVELAEQVKELTKALADRPITIAVMGCRVNGPGESDEADIGLWCGPSYVNLKSRGRVVGRYRYEEILGQLRAALREQGADI